MVDAVQKDRIVVVGSGAFGTALSAVAAASGKVPVTMTAGNPGACVCTRSRAVAPLKRGSA